MPKFDPSFLPPIETRTVSKSFTTKTGDAFDVTLEMSEGGEQALAILDMQEALWEKWKAGAPSSPGSAPIRVSRTLCLLIARLLVMQAPGEGEEQSDLWQFTHWATLAQRDPAAFAAVNTWLTEQLSGGDQNPPPASPLA